MGAFFFAPIGRKKGMRGYRYAGMQNGLTKGSARIFNPCYVHVSVDGTDCKSAPT